MKEYYIILGSNHYHQCQAYGTPTGKPFTSEKSAKKLMDKVKTKHPHLDFMVMDLNVSPVHYDGELNIY